MRHATQRVSLLSLSMRTIRKSRCLRATFELAENAAVWPRCREKEHLALDRTLQLELVKRSREFGSLYFEFHSSGRHFLPVQHEVQLPRAAQISPPAYTCAHH